MIQKPKDCRAGLGCVPGTFGEALACQVQHNQKKVAAIAEEIGVQYGYLCHAVNPDDHTIQFQARAIVPLCRATGSVGVLRFMAAQLNHLLVPLPTVGADDSSIYQKFLAIAKELGDVSVEIDRGFKGDNHLDGDERTRIAVQLSELLTAGASLLATIQSGDQA